MRRPLAPTRFLPGLLAVLLALLLPLPRAAADGAPAPSDGDAMRRLGLLEVQGDGFYRVPAHVLEGLGASASTAQVRRGGRPVPTEAPEPGGDLVFLARGTATAASRVATFELWGRRDGGAAERPTASQASRELPSSAAAVEPVALVTTHVDDADVMFGDMAAALPEVYAAPGTPTWFRYFIAPGQTIATPLPPLADDATHEEIEAVVYATRRGEVALRATWGGQPLGTARGPTAAGGATFRWLVPPRFGPPADARLELTDVSPPAPPPPRQDVSSGRGTLWVDGIRLRGRRVPRADAALATYEVASESRVAIPLAAAGAPVHVALTGGAAGDYRQPWVARTTSADGQPLLVVAVAGATHLHVAGTARDVTVTPAGPPADPLARAGTAAHLILATPPLVEPAERLAAHRRATGTTSVVVPVVDVYDRYGHGQAGVAPIRAFLQDRMTRPGAPLEYVLLAGDAAVDRVDLLPEVTIPAPMARTMYNGATAADRLYALPGDGGAVGGPSIGRLPFRTTEALDAFVTRLIRYETAPPVDASRRLMRFVTSEGRFGPFIDRILEQMFRTVVSTEIPPAYDVEITFASLASPYLWPPPEFNDKVIQGFSDGCLFYTYVGHGFAHGFDSLRAGAQRFPILTKQDVGRIDGHGTPPVTFVVACTTAMFDMPFDTGIGETLLAEDGGPIAYWGATRICHPAANTLLGRAIARTMAAGEGVLRLGQILDTARDQVLTKQGDPGRALIDFAIRQLAAGADPDRLALEGSWMYQLLGDPATRVAFPLGDIGVQATWKPDRVLEVSLDAALPDATTVHVSLEVPRHQRVGEPRRVEDPLAPASFETIRANHARMNDLRLQHREVRWRNGRAQVAFELPEGVDADGLVVKAWAIAAGDVHQGAVRVRVD